MIYLITGAAGFIGSHTAHKLLEQGKRVIGLDDLNDYYDVSLKQARLARLTAFSNFSFYEADISDKDAVLDIFAKENDITHVIHLAAQAGVRYSLTNPYAYINANVTGQVVLLEAARTLKNLEHFTYASSSSVYGGNKDMPFAVGDPVEQPVSLYAATKRSGELIAKTYNHLYQIPVTGLRFFTVYGPWGRPDMAAYLFTKAILEDTPIRVFNRGEMRRDFTYIDDIVDGLLAATHRGNLETPKLYNLGNSKSENLMDFIHTLETALGKKAKMDFQPLQQGDVPETFADIMTSRKELNFDPKTPISVGIPKFVDWYKSYHGNTT